MTRFTKTLNFAFKIYLSLRSVHVIMIISLRQHYTVSHKSAPTLKRYSSKL